MAMSSEEAAPSQNPNRKLKLVLKTSPLSTPVIIPWVNDRVASKDGSSSPPRPSYSPVTPTLSHEQLATEEKPGERFIAEPPPLPLSLDDNADAIAIKATLSLLQMQRQQSLKDIRDLDKLKDAALDDPRGFADELRAGKLKKPQAGEVVFDDVEVEDDKDEVHEVPNNKEETISRFSQLPNAQNIARCPPIEWSKYHIVGKPLEEIHETQKKYPGSTERDFASGRANEHEMTAPYRPFIDKLDIKKEPEGYSI